MAKAIIPDGLSSIMRRHLEQHCIGYIDEITIITLQIPRFIEKIGQIVTYFAQTSIRSKRYFLNYVGGICGVQR